jgi:hypothetical protein
VNITKSIYDSICNILSWDSVDAIKILALNSELSLLKYDIVHTFLLIAIFYGTVKIIELMHGDYRVSDSSFDSTINCRSILECVGLVNSKLSVADDLGLN